MVELAINIVAFVICGLTFCFLANLALTIIAEIYNVYKSSVIEMVGVIAGIKKKWGL